MSQFPQIMPQFCWQLGSLHIVPIQIISFLLSSQKQKPDVSGYPMLIILILEIMIVEGYYCISLTDLMLAYYHYIHHEANDNSG